MKYIKKYESLKNIGYIRKGNILVERNYIEYKEKALFNFKKNYRILKKDPFSKSIIRILLVVYDYNPDENNTLNAIVIGTIDKNKKISFLKDKPARLPYIAIPDTNETAINIDVPTIEEYKNIYESLKKHGFNWIDLDTPENYELRYTLKKFNL